jgi:YfiH family protein
MYGGSENDESGRESLPMEMRRSGRIHYLAADFPGWNGSVQGFTSRHEGVSRPPYNSLNLGMHTLDQPHNAEGNRSLLTRAFGTSSERLVTVQQVHGNDILVIDEPNEDYTHFGAVESDAVITSRPGVMIGVCVADCVPILLCDPVKRVVAAIHAGWRGTASRLAEHAVAGMRSQFGSDPATILAAIGPCIGPCCYEVDEPVRQAFDRGGVAWGPFARQTGEGAWRLDMAAANRELLLLAGLPAASIQVAGICVCCRQELFFSYRRDGGETGRQMGFIMLSS